MRRFPQPLTNNETSKPDFEDLTEKNLIFTTAVFQVLAALKEHEKFKTQIAQRPFSCR